MTGVFSRPGSSGVMFLCLDALSLSADSDAEAEPTEDAWSGNAAQLLGHAREQGWSVGHVISRRPRPGESPWRPVPALAPALSEPVYHREQPSAFSSPELFAALVGGAREVVVCGVSVRGSGLASALDAMRLDVRLTIAIDAVWLAQTERDGLEGLLKLQRHGLSPGLVRLASTHVLLGPWRRLRLVQGGRA